MPPARRPSARRLGTDDLGSRVVVRHRLADGSATDVLGVLDDVDATGLTIGDRHGTSHRIEQSAVIAAKRVPDPPRPRSARRPHVLVVGIDGVRWDELARCATPHIDAIGAAGFLRPVMVNPAAPTISGPSWATMVSGTLATTHRIVDNDLSVQRLGEHPDFVSLARTTHPGIAGFVGADWEPLVTADSGGPLFAGGGLLPERRRDAGAGPEDWEDADAQVAAAAAKVLAGIDADAGSASFVYQHGPDASGHATGVDDTYRRFIEASDARVGQLLAAVASRPTRDREQWLVIVATDHGHVAAGGHGGDSRAEREAWIAACGPDVPTGPGGDWLLEQADVAGHIAHVLGLPQGPHFVGLPFGRRVTPA